MSGPLLFPFHDYWWFYGGFVIFVLVMLALDLGVFHRKAHTVGFREAATWSAVWISLGLLFNLGLWWYARGQFGVAIGDRVALEFLTGWLIEYSLSVDNVFVIALILTYFAIPPGLQHRVLFYGILGALVFRALFIAVGSVLMQYHWVVVGAGVFLVFTGLKMAWAGEQKPDPARNPVLRLLRRLLPVSPDLQGQAFLVRKEGILHATPLLVALVMVEMSDIVFAIDSVPAIYAITSEPLLVFTSNIFAILGLRSLYFLLAGVMDRFWALKYALAAILVFVGLKMTWLNGIYGPKIPILWSLAVIGACLAAGAMLSLLWRRGSEPQDPA